VHDCSPAGVARVARRPVGEQLRANDRADAVGADQDVAALLAATFEARHDLLILLRKRLEPFAKLERVGAEFLPERLLQRAPMDAHDHFASLEARRRQRPAPRGSNDEHVAARAGGAHPLADAEKVQRTQGIRCEREPGADLL
jgi:hypothetical protein